MIGRLSQGSSGWRKRAPTVALAAAIALLLAGLALAIVNERSYQIQKIQEVSVEGRFLGVIVAAALNFNDRAAAQQYLDALKANPEARAAAVYDVHGRLFASYSSRDAPPLPKAPPSRRAVFKGNELVVSMPVVQQGRRLGTVYLDMITEPVGSRLQRYVGVGVLVTMAALLVVVLGAAHSALNKANAELETQAVDLAAANRQLRDQIEERERAEQALRQSQKMEAIGRLTGGVAHDFNNLLTVVAGNLDLIERMAATPARDGVPRDRLRRLVAAAQRGLSRGERLTRQLLALSRQEPVEAHNVDVNAMISDFAPLIQRAIGESVVLKLQLGSGGWRCRLDPAQFEAAMLNLAINARDAITGNGTLTIATSHVPPTEADPARPAAMPTAHVMVAVRDTGVGMQPDVLVRVFEPFYTTKSVGKGSGLGLAQVWAFVTQSGGHVTIDSEPGQGTTFRLFLPLSGEVKEDVIVEQRPADAPCGSETILIVEDEDDVREVTASTLNRLGYRTVVARDGHEALRAIASRADFDLLFTDFAMPNGISGTELAREALRMRPQLKVLMTSGYPRQAGAAASADMTRLDGFPLIAKPYRTADLAVRIRDVLEAVPASGAT